VLAEILMLFSNIVLAVEPAIFVLSLVTILVMSFALISLAVGLGAIMPNFKEDNPARIANGLGGTLNAIISLIYIMVTLGMEVIPAYLLSIGRLNLRAIPIIYPIIYVGIFALLQVSTIVLPMFLGLRHWKRIEF
jgi:ABC-2 type transport system permease protein